jgi:hypothetical protein
MIHHSNNFVDHFKSTNLRWEYSLLFRVVNEKADRGFVCIFAVETSAAMLSKVHFFAVEGLWHVLRSDNQKMKVLLYCCGLKF